MLGRFGVLHRSSSAAALLGRPAASAVRCTRRQAPIGTLIASTHSRWLSSERTVVLAPGPQISLGKSQEGRPAHRTFPNLWLRDNCQCTQCVNQDTRQRNFDTFQLPEDIHPISFAKTEEHLEVQWSDSHKSRHPWSWLESTFDGGYVEQFGQDHIESSPPEVPFDAVMSESDETGMANLTKNIRVHGFSFIVNTPPTPEATEAVLEKIGPIRTTHYGGFYDFIPDLALADTAYTNLALPAHTDTTYFTEPAGLQAFHLLSHKAPPNAKPTDDAGGQSLLVDGFNAATILKEEFPDAYETLRTTRIPWHASGNKGIAIVPDQTYPVIEQDGDVLTKVRWNNDDRGILNLVEANKWYSAARKWNSILKRRTSEYWFQLTPGRIVVFDNWRVLHGRAAFEGIRRICGAYIPRDDFMSRYKATNFPHETVIGRNLNLRSRTPPPRDQEEEAAITRAP
ncbi:hypothetical protein G7Z17_g5440 [Cylindrodendrum hubeiense]|uniref:Trimethyllysine dioxygenase n=1 Tax=Cylindrodendrum hubeiense TaxID=595255 RepID=A0A9P5LHB7_9HYPO|nr:hypothetical protein G7Z17_g5440 [Cylindrodendrum hubeiense]